MFKLALFKPQKTDANKCLSVNSKLVVVRLGNRPSKQRDYQDMEETSTHITKQQNPI